MDPRELLALIRGATPPEEQPGWTQQTQGFAPPPTGAALLARPEAPAPVPPAPPPPMQPVATSRRESISVKMPVGPSPELIAKVQNPIVQEFLKKKYVPSAAPQAHTEAVPSPEDAEMRDAQDWGAAMTAANAVSRAAAGFTETMTGAPMDQEFYRGLDRGTRAPVQNLLARREEARNAADYTRRAEHQGMQMALGQQSLQAGQVKYDAGVRDMQLATEADDPKAEMSVRGAQLLAGMGFPEAEGMSFTQQERMMPYLRLKMDDRQATAMMEMRAQIAEANRAAAGARADGTQHRADGRDRVWLAKTLKNAKSSQDRLERLSNIAAGKKIDGVGLLEGGLPQFLRSDAGKAIVQDAYMEFNKYINDLSGAAVSEYEEGRMRKALGMISTTDDEQVFRNGVRLLQESSAGAMQTALSGVGDRPAVYEGFLDDARLYVPGHPKFDRRAQWGKPGPGASGPAPKGGASPAQTPPRAPPPGKVKVSNGAETLYIDPSDEAAAAREGFRRTP